MRTATITAAKALSLRMHKPYQIALTDPESDLPPYLESFLAHLRVLVGVPFEYLVPDPRLLPAESIRFFYVDRSWTDRLVDGTIAVGKIGSREQAHHQAHAESVSQRLDLTERIVRDLQRTRGSFGDLQTAAPRAGADTITGFLLRSSAVSGWPHMDVRAYRENIPENTQTGIAFDPQNPEIASQQLRTLRLERLAPSILFALFEGVPKLMILEEPHHGVQFGLHQGRTGYTIDLRRRNGSQIFPAGSSNAFKVNVPMRPNGRRVVAVTALRNALEAQVAAHNEMPHQTGGGSFALEVLQPPWRQRFEGTTDESEIVTGRSSGFAATLQVAALVKNGGIVSAYQSLIIRNP